MDGDVGHTPRRSMHGDENHGDHAVANADHTGHEAIFRRRFWISLVLSVPVILFSPMIQAWFGYTLPAFPGSPWVAPVFAAAVFGYGGLPFLSMAVPEVRSRQPGMMLLISLAITVSFTYSLAAFFAGSHDTFFWELATLVDIMLLGHWLEMKSVRQASRALDELARLLPDRAERVLPDGRTEIVATADLVAEDLVLVRPGAAVPADGIVESGESDVNESMITGESRPVDKTPRDPLIAGSINGAGSLRLRIDRVGGETALAGIMRLVAQAQQGRSRTQVLADRAAGWLFYVALAVAAATGIGWTVAVGLHAEVVARVATVLVIACPHALGLAIPLVVAITTGVGARAGILVRDRASLERARNVDVVVFDKTGTLTKGEFGLAAMVVADGWGDACALAWAAAVEKDSEHLIGRTVRQAADIRGLKLPEVGGFEALKGRGARATIDGRTVHVGGPALLDSLATEVPPRLAAFRDSAEEKGQTVVHLLVDSGLVATFALSDVVREESAAAVQRLHALGIEPVLLTGDSDAVAKSVARELGIDRYFAQVLPEHKERRVAELQAQGKRVAMVGDGINDAPALARADVGIAIGSGTQVAIESAGIILVRNDPEDVARTIGLARASYRKMVQNLAWATGYNVVALPLAAGILAPVGVILSPALGAVLMSLSTIIVALNSQFLRRHPFG